MERNEAIEVIRKNYPHVSGSGTQFETALRTLIPELKESEGERIREELLNAVQESEDSLYLVMTPQKRKSIIAWLEKQGSQNLANSAKTCKDEQKPTLPCFEEQEGVAGRDYIPVEWVETIENFGKWKIVRVNDQNLAWSKEDNPYYDDICEILINLLHSEIADINKDAIQKDLDWLKFLKERIKGE